MMWIDMALMFVFCILVAAGSMDNRGLHGLSCKHSAGHFPRHSAMNNMINVEIERYKRPVCYRFWSLLG